MYFKTRVVATYLQLRTAPRRFSPRAARCASTRASPPTTCGSRPMRCSRSSPRTSLRRAGPPWACALHLRPLAPLQKNGTLTGPLVGFPAHQNLRCLFQSWHGMVIFDWPCILRHLKGTLVRAETTNLSFWPELPRLPEILSWSVLKGTPCER